MFIRAMTCYYHRLTLSCVNTSPSVLICHPEAALSFCLLLRKRGGEWRGGCMGRKERKNTYAIL